jgi:hypothetical protein
MPAFVVFDGRVLGRVVENMKELTGDVLDATCGGAPGVLFKRADGSFGVEDVNDFDVCVISAKNAKEALRKAIDGDV